MKTWIVIALTFLTLPALANGQAKGRDCAPELEHRSAAEVLEAHRAALNAGDWDAVACNYAADAIVISDQGVTHGRENVVLDLQGLAGLFGGTFPQVNQEVIVSVLNDKAEMARVLWYITLPCVSINDGADTYIIKKGQIHSQTAHGFPTFTCPF